jgi:hypothetical protein
MTTWKNDSVEWRLQVDDVSDNEGFDAGKSIEHGNMLDEGTLQTKNCNADGCHWMIESSQHKV